MNPEEQFSYSPAHQQPQQAHHQPQYTPHHEGQSTFQPQHHSTPAHHEPQTHYNYSHQPPMHEQPTPIAPPKGVQPTPVVKVLSPYGIEYVFLTILLFTNAIALTSILLLLVNGESGFEALSFPAAMMLVALPIFGWLFLRLKKMELTHPELRLDASKRRSTQFTQIAAFIVCLSTLIGFVFSIFLAMGGGEVGSIGKSILSTLCILAVSGGILAYYWRNEHAAK